MRRSVPTIRWRQAFFFGLPLALLEIGLFGVSMAYSSRLLPQLAILIGVLLYFVIPAIAGYWFCHRRHSEESEGGWIGFRVGIVGFAVFMLGAIIMFAFMFIRYLTTPRAPHQWGIYDPAWELSALVSILGILALLNGVGVLLSAIGGLIGGALAKWTISTHIQPGHPQA